MVIRRKATLPSGSSRGGERSGRGTCAGGCEECGAGKGGSVLRQSRPSHCLRPTKPRPGVPTAGARVPLHPNGVAGHIPRRVPRGGAGRAAADGRRHALPPRTHPRGARRCPRVRSRCTAQKQQRGGRGGPRPAWRAIQKHETSTEPAEVDTAKRQEDGMLSSIVLEWAFRGTHLQHGKQVTSRRRVDGQCTVPNQVGKSEEN